MEEYKRPTFEVKFDEVKDNYQDGDTLDVKAKASSYAGVPVQEAKVKYKVVRRRSMWWWSYSSYWNRGAIGDDDDETVAEGETMTASDGTFSVKMPMVLPKTDYPMFYNFVCSADVTDQAGETHQRADLAAAGQPQDGCSPSTLPEQIRTDQMPQVKLPPAQCRRQRYRWDSAIPYQ